MLITNRQALLRTCRQHFLKNKNKTHYIVKLMKRIKYNLTALISVRHKVQIFTVFRRDNICKEHIRENCFV